LNEGVDEKIGNELENGRHKRKLAFLPGPGELNYEFALVQDYPERILSLDITHTIFYHGHWLKVGSRE
jgi:hypothetical protein